MQVVDCLPILKSWEEELYSRPTISTHGHSAYVRTPTFICRLELLSSNLRWLVERSCVRFSESAKRLPRRIWVPDWEDASFWISKDGLRIAEIGSAECGGLTLAVRDAITGKQLWEKLVSAPRATDWSEPDPVPSLPGDQEDDTWALLLNSPAHLILCLIRATTRTVVIKPGMTMSALPQARPAAGQTEDSPPVPRFRAEMMAVRMDPATGAEIWRERYLDVIVDSLKRGSFDGVWSNGSQVGVIDLDTGTNKTLFQSANLLGWPERDGSTLAVPWHAERHVGIEWIDAKNGRRARAGSWALSGVHTTWLRATGSGLGLQTNDQSFWWLGKEDAPLWNVRAKPYIYRVYHSAGTDVFIGTDGNGGRLLAFDADSGAETLNIKPAAGGFGSMEKVPGHAALVSHFRVSRSWSALGRLLVLPMNDSKLDIAQSCTAFVGTWEHGAVICVGKKGERLAVIDIRSSLT